MTKKEEFIEFIKEKVFNFNCTDILKDAITYSLISDGKYIRPMLFLSYLEDNDYDYKNYFDVALAIEMIHTYSLIHDDMPCIDNDDYRRGKLSTHKKFGQDIALLTGDALLTNAFSILMYNEILEDDQKVYLVKKLSNYAGVEGMVDGQIKDIINEVSKIEDVKDIHFKKTSLLISFSLEAASIIVKDNKKEELFELASLIGLFYQIQDDYLDEYGEDSILGKTKGKDLENGKKTYAYFYSKKDLENIIKDMQEDIFKGKNLLGDETIKIMNLITKRKK